MDPFFDRVSFRYLPGRRNRTPKSIVARLGNRSRLLRIASFSVFISGRLPPGGALRLSASARLPLVYRCPSPLSVAGRCPMTTPYEQATSLQMLVPPLDLVVTSVGIVRNSCWAAWHAPRVRPHAQTAIGRTCLETYLFRAARSGVGIRPDRRGRRGQRPPAGWPRQACRGCWRRDG